MSYDTNITYRHKDFILKYENGYSEPRVNLYDDDWNNIGELSARDVDELLEALTEIKRHMDRARE